MSGAAERIRRALNTTGVYALTGESSADWEGNACAAGIDGLDEEMDGLLGDLFPATAGEARLDCLERLYRPQPAQTGTEERRELLHCRTAVNPRCFRAEDFDRMIRGAGVYGETVLREGVLKVVVGRLAGLTETESRRELDLILPAHLQWQWVEEMNWAALDVWAGSFAGLDGLGLCWNDFDGLSRTQWIGLAGGANGGDSEETEEEG